ncbi:hypothetical protein KSS87_012264 [Heliosperma pusillum]|nr:hypothetical protein KSS87_012264 [Heliosperma pusillum]
MEDPIQIEFSAHEKGAGGEIIRQTCKVNQLVQPAS